MLGAGGMGEVYRATDSNLKRLIALKVLPDALASDGEHLARFQREAQVLASLNHPNIAAVHGLERTGTTTALVMELVEGPILFTSMRTNQMPQILVQSLDSATGPRVVVDEGADARYVPTGHLVYALDDALVALPFDVTTLAVTGGPVSLVESVARSPDGIASYSAVSNEGALMYVPRDALGNARTLVWVDRQARETPIKAAPRAHRAPRLSPEETRIAVDIRDQENDIHIWDLARETLTRLTDGPTYDFDPLWTLDGQSVIFGSGASTNLGERNLFRRRADGTGTVDQLTHDMAAVPKAITLDGKLIFVQSTSPSVGGRADVMLLTLIGDHWQPQPLLNTRFLETNAELSPNGRWLAYESNESGQPEVYVRPFPNVAGEKKKLSQSGGTKPLWAKNGRELFYVSRGAVMSVPVTTETGFTIWQPSPVV